MIYDKLKSSRNHLDEKQFTKAKSVSTKTNHYCLFVWFSTCDLLWCQLWYPHKNSHFLVGSYFICYLYLFTYIWCQTSFLNHMMFVFNCNTRVSLVEQELLTFPKHQSSPRLLVLLVLLNLKLSVKCFVDHCVSLLAIVLSVLLITSFISSSFS